MLQKLILYLCYPLFIQLLEFKKNNEKNKVKIILDFFVGLEYNFIMKKLVLFLGIFSFIVTGCLAEEISPATEAGMMTSEIDSSFANITPKKSFFHKVFKQEKKVTKKDNSAPKEEAVSNKTEPKAEPKKESKTEAKTVNKPEIKTENKSATKVEQKAKPETPKEAVHSTEPAEKVIKSEQKEQEELEKKLQTQEEERKKYKELQELTEQYQQAVALYTDNNLDGSMEAFIKIPEEKRPAEAWFLMGNILMDKDKKDEAVFMYGRAIMTDPKFYKSYYNLGNIYLADDKFNMALEQYKLAAKHNPNNAYVFYNMGCTYLKLGELRKAKTAFIRALELNNKVADFHYNMAYVYKKLGKEKQAKAFLDNYNKLTGEI